MSQPLFIAVSSLRLLDQVDDEEQNDRADGRRDDAADQAATGKRSGG